MVEVVNVYCCPYCHEQFDNRGDAEDCAEDCAPRIVDPPFLKQVYICEICGKKSEDPLIAAECEEEHEANNDRLWRAHLDKLEREKLLIAGHAPNQKKLEGFT